MASKKNRGINTSAHKTLPNLNSITLYIHANRDIAHNLSYGLRSCYIMTNYISINDHEEDRPSLSMDERIVWISDNGPEYGNVRWLGKLHDLGREWMAGVEFDNPVGSGTGLYKDRQLFVTRLNHASLVPVIGLLKASDFDGSPETRLCDGTPGSSHLIDFDRTLSPVNPHIASLESTRHESSPSIKNLDEKYNLDDAYRQFHDELEQIASLRSHQPVISSQGRVRQIPIQIEREPRTVRHSSNDNPRQRPTIQARPSTSSSSSTSYDRNRARLIKVQTDQEGLIRNITSALAQTSLEDDTRPSTHQDLPVLPPPALIVMPGDKDPAVTLERLLGKSRGIQGHNNSCYLDATLFAMYSSTTLFDSLLYRPPKENDIPEYPKIQRILREDIVRPLREQHIVSADQVMLFRTMLERSSGVEGLTDEEKDPEEFLSLLLGQILKAEPYLKLSSGLESFFYQLIVDKDENVVLPTVQDLFDQSFIGSTVRLREIPPCLLMQMPRFDVLESAPRSCGHRGKHCDNIARYECKDCMHEQSGRNNTRLSSITYCHNCFRNKHFGKSHITGIEDHDKTKTLLNMTPNDAIIRYSNKLSNAKDRKIPRICMDLFAVLCIETSHYVCFVKCGSQPDSPWCFFDSMADRKGEQDGYNIPEVLLFDDFAFWTSDDGVAYLLNHRDDKLLPELARRLICDAYLCFYQYNGLATYR